MQAVLLSRVFMYRLFQSLFGSEPSKEQMSIVAGNESRQAICFFSIFEDAPYDDSAKAFSGVLSQLRESLSESIDALKSEYTRHYLGPEKLAAPPWESVYVSKKRLVFQESTLGVRQAYYEQGYRAKAFRRVPDDHIAIECDFVASLAQRACDALDEDDSIALREALEASLRFLEEHLSVWIVPYAADLANAENAPFYAPVACLARDFVALDKRILEELVSSL